jgi:catechol 2,3-dioxygenase-like lactoylglutathione lyase family enzyme
MPNISGLSHIALIVRDIHKMIDFYREFAGMEVIHDRIDDGINVAWLRLPEASSLVIVMIEDKNLEVNTSQRMNHFGFDAVSKEAVDLLAKKGEEWGVLVQPAVDGGKILGYLCLVKDPDGNQLEFAYGQMRTSH